MTERKKPRKAMKNPPPMEAIRMAKVFAEYVLWTGESDQWFLGYYCGVDGGSPEEARERAKEDIKRLNDFLYPQSTGT